MKRIIQKLQTHKGFSLTEMLTTVIIMSIVLAGITAGITTARRVYGQIKLAANAQTLMSTAITAMNADLSSAEQIDGSTFVSGNRGYRMQFVSEEGNIYVQNIGESSASRIPLVTSKTKTEDLRLDLDGGSVSFVPDTSSSNSGGKENQKKGYFTYTLIVRAVKDNSSFQELTRKICVRPVGSSD